MSVSEKKEKESWECVYFSLQFNFNGCGRGQACEKQTWTVNLSSKNRVHREKKKLLGSPRCKCTEARQSSKRVNLLNARRFTLPSII